jgi:hypothetical protein
MKARKDQSEMNRKPRSILRIRVTKDEEREVQQEIRQAVAR